jgi:hypothetical protein
MILQSAKFLTQDDLSPNCPSFLGIVDSYGGLASFKRHGKITNIIKGTGQLDILIFSFLLLLLLLLPKL